MIYAIKEGKIIEKGKHEELITKKGYYTSIIKSEIKKDILGDNELHKMKEMAMRNILMTYSVLKGKTIKYELEHEKEDEIEFKLSNIFELIKDKK